MTSLTPEQRKLLREALSGAYEFVQNGTPEKRRVAAALALLDSLEQPKTDSPYPVPVSGEARTTDALPPKIQAVIDAAGQWWCERSPMNWDDAALAHAIVAMDGDWSGCEGCDFKCDEPCVPHTEAEQHWLIDAAIAQLIHEGKLLKPDGYTPPDGWKPREQRTKRPMVTLPVPQAGFK